jgi:serine/threonine-protein kinase HipA
MKKARVLFDGVPAGLLSEEENGFAFEYLSDYKGPSISRTLPREGKRFVFRDFPAFFDGLLPEGPNLEMFLRKTKLDRQDYLSQLITAGRDLVGAVTVEKWDE